MRYKNLLFGMIFLLGLNLSASKTLQLAARYNYSPDGELQSVLIPVSKTGAVKQTYVYKYESMGTRIVSVYKKFLEFADVGSGSTLLPPRRESVQTDPNASWHDYKEKFAQYDVASRGTIPTGGKLGILIRKYAEKAGRKLYEIDILGNKTEYRYNNKGQLVKISSSGRAGGKTQFAVFKYNKFGRLSSTEDILGRLYERELDAEGHLTGLVLPDGTRSVFNIDKYGRLVKKSGAGTYPLSFKYNSFGEITSYTDANGVTTAFQYDDAGRLIYRIWSDGSKVEYSYNKKGLLATKKESDRITGYFYDDLNRLKEINVTQAGSGLGLLSSPPGKSKYKTDPDISVTKLSYNKNGNLVKITDNKTSIEYGYDNFDRVTYEKGPVGTIQYKYNSAGLLFEKISEIRGSNQKFSTKYFYDKLNRIVRVESPAGVYKYSYNKRGKIAKLTLNNGSEIVYTYDKAGRLLSKILVFAGMDRNLCSYKYDLLDRRISVTVNGVSWRYKYDEKNQLIEALAKTAADKEVYKYKFDSIGNRLADVNNQYAYNNLNQIINSGYLHDKFGNLIKTSNASYKYDLHNRLVEVKEPDMRIVYSYDPLGQRIKSEEFNPEGKLLKTTLFLMSGMVEQGRKTGSSVQFHTLGLDLAGTLNATGGVGAVLASTRYPSEEKPSTINYLYDANGNVISAFSPYGETVASIRYSPFGKIISEKGTRLQEVAFKFSTKAVDKSGLNYYGYRWYDSELGRWLSRDPINEIKYELSGLWNQYKVNHDDFKASSKFVANNPINRFDRWGLQYECWPCEEGDIYGTRQKEDHVPSSNGCGSPPVNVPDDPMQQILFQPSCSFTSACNAHDVCYDTCNNEKNSCDFNFRIRIRDLCDFCANDHYPGNFFARQLYLAICNAMAEVYFAFVNFSPAGQSAYDNAQNNACEDCCCEG